MPASDIGRNAPNQVSQNTVVGSTRFSADGGEEAGRVDGLGPKLELVMESRVETGSFQPSFFQSRTWNESSWARNTFEGVMLGQRDTQGRHC